MKNARRPARSRNRGFTLVELLVVIGIIAVLVALLFPAINKVREHANRVKCAANLRSIGLALQGYTERYGYYPGWAIGGKYISAIWPVRLRPFMSGNQDVFLCPSRDERFRWKRFDSGEFLPRANASDARYGYEEGEPLLVTGAPKTSFFSYGYNWLGAGSPGGSIADGSHKGLGKYVDADRWGPEQKRIFSELRASRVKVPSEMIAIADSAGMGWYDTAISGTGEGATPWGNPGTIHGGGANVLFCDGHVTWHLQKDLMIFTNPATENTFVCIRRWCNDNAVPREF